MNRVLLFNPQSEFYAMPLGLLAVGSALPAAEFDVKIIDARLNEDAEQQMLDGAASACCVGMTVFSGPSIGKALRLSRRLKQENPRLPIVWGGWHPSILPEQCIASGAVDAVVIAQGEATFADLLRVIGDRSRWARIPGLCIENGGTPQRTAPRALARMEQFPPARYELLDVESYFQRKGVRQLDYSSSRGCPYRCTFCADPLVYRSKWTGLPADRVAGELQELHRRYRLDEVFFLDDDLFASPRRIQALASEFVRIGVPFKWKGTARADELCRLPEDFFAELHQAGCVRINIGAESGSQHVLDHIKKDYQVDEILTAAQRAARAGIGLSYSFIAGFPGEQQSDLDRTIDVMKQIRRESPAIEAKIFFYSPYPGTELIREVESMGVQLPSRLEDWDGFNIDRAWTPVSRPAIERRVRNINFYLRHGYAARQVSLGRRLLSGLAKARCRYDWYGLPVERYVSEALQRVRL